MTCQAQKGDSHGARCCNQGGKRQRAFPWGCGSAMQGCWCAPASTKAPICCKVQARAAAKYRTCCCKAAATANNVLLVRTRVDKGAEAAALKGAIHVRRKDLSTLVEEHLCK